MYPIGLGSMHADGLRAVPDLPAVISISNRLRDSLLAAIGDLPPGRSLLTRADVLLAIAQGKGSGASFLRYVLAMTTDADGSIYNPRSLAELVDALRERQDEGAAAEPPGGTLTIDTNTVVIASSLRDQLAIARQYALSYPIETGDVIAADASSPASILVPILSGWGARVAGDVLPRYAASDTARRPEEYEDGAVAVRFEPSPDADPAPGAAAAASAPQPAAPPASNARAAVRDLIAEAKAQSDPHIVRPGLAHDLIGVLDQLPLAVLVSARAFERGAAVQDLAALIASDDAGVLHYRNLIEPDPDALAARPYATLSAAIERAQGGIAHVPGFPEYSSDSNVAALVQKAITGGKAKIIVSMSNVDWKTEQAKPLYRRGRALLPPPPKADEIKRIFMQWKPALERQYGKPDLPIGIGESAIAELAKLAARYPADPFDLLGTAAAGVRMSESQGLRKTQPVAYSADRQIDATDIDRALQQLTGIVVAPEDPDRYLGMETELKKSVVAQDEAIHVVSEAIITAMGGIKDAKRPTGAFIFMGPTGVGKSELARALAQFLFNDPNGVLRFDMSEYMEKHEVARLIGAPPGYIGYEEGGQLTEAVRRKPYSVVLFDEFEKAHPDVMNAALQILEEGKLTDGKGQVADFGNTIVIFTGNVGAEAYGLIGQTDGNGEVVTEERVKRLVREQVRRTFRPEFLNRIGDENAEEGESNVVVFNMLKPEHMLPIAEIELAKMNRLLAENGLSVEVSAEVKEALAREGYSARYGARPLVRLIKRKLGFPIAQKFLRREFVAGDRIRAELVDGEIVFSK